MIFRRPAMCVLVAQAWIALAAFDGLKTIGFARIHDRVSNCRVRQQTRRLTTAEEVVWAVDEACVWYVKGTACLQRSAVATWLLRRRGFAAALVIGYRPIPFESHAWVELDGTVVNDLPQYARAFTVLERL
jgi:hypothetical protein